MLAKVFKQEKAGELRLQRKILDRRDLLVLKRDLCNGCGICAEVCPKDSINIKSAIVENGKLSQFPAVDINVDTCILCGVCADLCPLGALEAWVNEEKKSMFLENEALPQMVKNIEVAKEMCRSDCGIECEKSCPREAINVVVQKENDRIEKIVDVKVDCDLCIYCKICEYACPYWAINVVKFLEGSVEIAKEKCPPDCQVCVDICPSKAIVISQEGKVNVSKEMCIYCKACQNTCPEGLVNVKIERVSHTPIKSATWISLLEQFASYRVASNELATRSGRKLEALTKSRWRNRVFPEPNEEDLLAREKATRFLEEYLSRTNLLFPKGRKKAIKALEQVR